MDAQPRKIVCFPAMGLDERMPARRARGERDGAAPIALQDVAEDESPESRPAPGAISALIDELASAPERDLQDAWDRGHHPGRRVDKFELMSELGRGGFGVVFEAHDLELGRRVAFKAIRPRSRERDLKREELLRREAEAVARLQHPNIVTLHDLGRCESGPYLILELLRGETLSRRMERGTLPPREALRIGIDVARALVHAHAQGVLHRDLKPGNVFLTDDGAVKVLDFGLSHVFGAGGPAGSGTPGYMAPEQLRGEPEDARTDVFALGVVLFEMITGRRLLPEDAARPAETPRIARAGAPPALSDAVARMLDPDPQRRPRDAAQVLRRLVHIQRGLMARARGLRRRIAIVAAISLLAAAAASGWFFGSRQEPTIVAVADTENGTGEPDLDEVSGMLAKSLEQSRRLTIVPRRRLVDAWVDGGHAQPQRLDAAPAESAARTVGAQVLLLTAVNRQAASYSIEVRALDLRQGSERFRLRDETNRKERVPEILDRLAERARQELHETAVEVGHHDIRITSDLDAYDQYFRGLQCLDRPVYGEDCGVYFRRAVEKDPAFALAHYELAVWDPGSGPVSRQEQIAAIRRAAAYAERSPEKERILIQAWKAHLEGHDDTALSLYRNVVKRWPDDVRPWFQAGHMLRQRDEFAAAIPWLEHVIQLNPDSGKTLGDLVESLAIAGRRDAIRERVREWERAPGPATLHGLSLAYGWLGDPLGAARAAQRGVPLGVGLPAQQDLLAALIFAGDYDSTEPGLRALAAPESPVRPLGYYALAAIDAYRGRWRSGLEKLDALRREIENQKGNPAYQTLRVDYVVGAGRPEVAWHEIEVLRALDRGSAAEHAAGLAWLGDLAHAELLARDLRPGSLLARTYEAVAAFRRGEDGGLDRLRDLSRATPLSLWRVAPLYLYGELAAEAGRDAEAAEAFGRFHGLYVPRMMWRSWAYPRSLFLQARSYERLGRTEKAREAVDRLLGNWAHAEETQPLLADARALQARLRAPERR